MESSKQDVLEHVRGASPSGRTTKLVAIDGRGGSGKSTLATWLASELGGEVVHVDDFGRPGVPYDAWDWDRLLSQVIAPLAADRPTRYQVYDWVEDRLGDWVDLAPGGVVLVEGVSSMRGQLGDPWDVTVWVEAPYDLRLERGIQRDGEAMRTAWVDEWMPQEEAYVSKQSPQERADFIILGY